MWKYGSGSTTSAATTASPSATTITSTTTTATTNTNTATSYQPTNAVPGSSSTKYVWAHHMVGNTYPYGYNDWMSDIKLAAANGIDGFVLNIGYDSWQPARVADAYNAAANSGTGFKVCSPPPYFHASCSLQMMLSLDMDVFSCYDWTYGSLLQDYLNKYITHSAAAKVNGKSALSTFAGSACTFGRGNTNDGWNALFGSLKNSIYFMPAYFVDPTALGSYDIAADVNWGAAWPSGGSDIDLSRDQWYMQQLSPSGKKLVATVSPIFYTHFAYKVCGCCLLSQPSLSLPSTLPSPVPTWTDPRTGYTAATTS